MIEAAIVLFLMLGVLFLLLGGSRYRGSVPAQTMRGLRWYRAPGSSGGFLGGLLSALAAASFAGVFGAATTVGVSLGVLVGIGVSAAGYVRAQLRSLVYGVCGAAGIAGNVWSLIAEAECAGGLVPRLLAVAVVVVAGLVGAFLALVLGRLEARSALSLFGALEIATFLASPLGIAVFDLGFEGVLIACVAAALVGFFAFTAPGIVIGLSAVGVTITGLLTPELGLVACGVAQGGGLLVVLGFVVTYFAISAVSGLGSG